MDVAYLLRLDDGPCTAIVYPWRDGFCVELSEDGGERWMTVHTTRYERARDIAFGFMPKLASNPCP